MQFQTLYSKYYDLLYKNKDYQSEADYLIQLLKRSGFTDFNSVIEFGCGTGKHAPYLAKAFKSWSGIDLSSAMVEEAKRNLSYLPSIDVQNCSIQDFKPSHKYDCVMSLFHVASYQIQNSDLELFFKKANEALKVGGFFVFDYWYGPAVLIDPPRKKEIEVSNDDIQVIRKTTPTTHYDKNYVNVHFDVMVKDRHTNELGEIKEDHKMRYLFLPEVHYFANKMGFSVVRDEHWLTGKDLSADTWYGVTVLKKIS